MSLAPSRVPDVVLPLVSIFGVGDVTSDGVGVKRACNNGLGPRSCQDLACRSCFACSKVESLKMIPPIAAGPSLLVSSGTNPVYVVLSRLGD